MKQACLPKVCRELRLLEKLKPLSHPGTSLQSNTRMMEVESAKLHSYRKLTTTENKALWWPLFRGIILLGHVSSLLSLQTK